MDNEENLVKLSKPMREALGKIIGRCEKSGIEYEWDAGLDGKYDLFIYIQQGKGKRRICMYNVNVARELLDSEFEKYVFVEGYEEAICCYEKSYVEAVVEEIRTWANKAMILDKLTGKRLYEDYKELVKKVKEGVDIRFELAERNGEGVKISIGNPSKTFLAMLNYLAKEGTLTVRVEGLEIGNAKEAAEKLGRITNSLFFELRKKRSVELIVERHYEVKTLGWFEESRVRRKGKSIVGFPKFEYDKEAIELY